MKDLSKKDSNGLSLWWAEQQKSSDHALGMAQAIRNNEIFKDNFKEKHLIWFLYILKYGYPKNTLKRYLKELFPKCNTSPTHRPMIAVHYNEGLNCRRRNDLNWFWNSGINQKNILIYVDNLSTPEAFSNELNDFQCVSLVKNEYPYWTYRPRARITGIPLSPLDWWVFYYSMKLLKRINYWKAFYKYFNIKLIYIPEDGLLEAIPQTLAMDGIGYSIGKQRSELYTSSEISLGHFCKDIYFVWSERTKKYLTPNYSNIKEIIVSGYETLPKFEDLTLSLREKGFKFVVCILDTGHGPTTHSAKSDVEACYNRLFELPIGFIIKPKKPKFFNALNIDIPKDRCVIMENPWGMYPMEAATGTDLSIGMGISSAITEVVVNGQRGIHYDLLNLTSHEFYEWGKDRLIFNDLDVMIEAIKKHIETKDNLGDWEEHKFKLDPYCDNRGSYRMGKKIQELYAELTV